MTDRLGPRTSPVETLRILLGTRSILRRPRLPHYCRRLRSHETVAWRGSHLRDMVHWSDHINLNSFSKRGRCRVEMDASSESGERCSSLSRHDQALRCENELRM